MSNNHHPGGSHQNHPSHPLNQDEFASVLQPPNSQVPTDTSDPAVDLIRQKLAAIYGNTEPDAKQELSEALAPSSQHSRHQQFMKSLHDSGRTAAQIQTEWHQYYMNLNDAEKREVWQEFYDQSAHAKQQTTRIDPKYTYQPEQPAYDIMSDGPAPRPQPSAQNQPVQPTSNPLYGTPASETPTIAGQPAAMPATGPTAKTAEPIEPPDVIRRQLRETVGRRSQLRGKHHVQSLLFGLGFGGLTLLIVLFSFFNEVVIAPFIQPSRTVNATPIIVSPDGVTASDKNEVIIPKINVQIPLDFSAKTTNEKEFEAALDKGVAHYPTTALPGQKGNASFFGHSSNNIFNPGKYKFAFVMLNELVPGDTFYVTYGGVAYAYQVYDKQIVEATAVEILNPVEGKTATAMLVTCDPPGTSLRRLVVWGEQVSPNPDSNAATTATPAPAETEAQATEALPGNGPTLWSRFRNWVF